MPKAASVGLGTVTAMSLADPRAKARVYGDGWLSHLHVHGNGDGALMVEDTADA
jgi:hypothetical protein